MFVTPEHIAGLVVGEGCFYAESRPDPKYLTGWRIRPAFCIEMREDDRDVLTEVKRHLNCGRIYALDFARYKGYEAKGWHPHVKYRVGNVGDIHGKVVPFFHRYSLFGRKRIAFDLFAKLAQHVYDKDHLIPEYLPSIKILAAELAAFNKRGK